MSIKIDPICPTGCSDVLPNPAFDHCDPKVKFGEIQKIYVASLNADPLNDWTSAVEWATRIDNDDSADEDKIRELTVAADKPAPEFDVVEISDERKIKSPSSYTINITIDDNSDENYEFMRWTACNTTIRFWYATKENLYGGAQGQIGQLHLDEVIERGNKSLITLVGTLTWENKYAPERTTNPLN
jgi:hypothetical protein